MKILYKNKKIEKDFSSEFKKHWKYPEQVKRRLIQLEDLIHSFESLQDILNYIPLHFHQLIGNRKSEWSLYLWNTGYRVTLIPCDENGEYILEGDIIAQCKTIKVVQITEVSNHYE